MISGQICGSKLQSTFTLGEVCWLPNKLPGWREQDLPKGEVGIAETEGESKRERKREREGERERPQTIMRQPNTSGEEEGLRKREGLRERERERERHTHTYIYTYIYMPYAFRRVNEHGIEI